MSQKDIPFPPDGKSLMTDDTHPNRKIGAFKHPMAAFFHVIFKSLALLFYLLGGLFGQDFKSTFVAVILLISMDFWVVKNVTGRLLANLRWSNYIDDEGNSHWIFENKRSPQHLERFDEEDRLDDRKDTTADSTLFWTALILTPAIWTLLILICVFKLNIQWLMLVTLASVLSFSNLYGYLRCRIDTNDIKSSLTQFVAKQVFLNYLTGGGGASSKSQGNGWKGRPKA